MKLSHYSFFWLKANFQNRINLIFLLIQAVLYLQGFLTAPLSKITLFILVLSLVHLHGFLLTQLFFQNLKKQCKQRSPCIYGHTACGNPITVICHAIPTATDPITKMEVTQSTVCAVGLNLLPMQLKKLRKTYSLCVILPS